MILAADKVREMMPSRESMATTFVNDCMLLIIGRAKKGLGSVTISITSNEEPLVDSIVSVFIVNGYHAAKGEGFIEVSWCDE